jgi:hypothetical protein
MFMLQIASTGVCARHVNTRYYFIRESVKEGTIKIKFFGSCDNNTNIFTKNVIQETNKQHIQSDTVFLSVWPSISFYSCHKFGWYNTFFDSDATNLVMVNMGSMCNASHGQNNNLGQSYDDSN